MRDTQSTNVLTSQNVARNGGVAILTENTDPIAKKHNAESVVAFEMSRSSERLLDSRLDL